MAQKFNVPPRTFFADVFRAIIGDIIPAVHRFNSVATVTFKPITPNVLPWLALAVTPQRVSMITVSSWILFQCVKIRNSAHFITHELLVTTLR